MPNQKFEYHPQAIQEAWEAFHWYEQRSESAAEGFWGELRRARQSATRHPHTWSPYLFGTRCFQLQRFPYGLVYVERGSRIVGIAVAHLKRRPGYWRKRLAE
jgi:plasmid stabilization system protein ParE